jgi:hypothetical protein
MAPTTSFRCPDAAPVKGWSQRYYAPGSTWYAIIAPTTCFASVADAVANGYPSHG